MFSHLTIVVKVNYCLAASLLVFHVNSSLCFLTRYKKHPDAVVGLGSISILFHSDEVRNYRGFKLAYKSKPLISAFRYVVRGW